MIGCASIVGDTSQNIGISSEPKSASVVITNEDGRSVFEGTTPATVNLDKGDGYFSGQSYMIRISKKGYESQTIPVTAQPNGWYIAGNFVFGGLIGWFIVDPATGAMWNLTPDEITASLHENDSDDQSASAESQIKVTLLQDVPVELRSKMTKIR
jgi:hypothetical protein